MCEYTYEWRHTGVHATVYVQVQRKSCEKIARDECEVRWGGSHFCFEGKARISDTHTALVMPEATALRRPGASTGEEDRFLTTNLDAPSMPPGEEHGQPWRICNTECQGRLGRCGQDYTWGRQRKREKRTEKGV